MKDEATEQTSDYSSFIPQPSSFIKSFLVKIHQFDRRHRGFESLVTLFGACPIDGLFERVRGHDAIDYGYASLHAGLCDALGNLAGDVFKVRSLPANHRAQTDDCVELARLCHLQGQQGNLERAGNLIELDRVFTSTQTIESIKRAFNQTPGNEIVPAAGDDREAKSFRVQSSLMSNCLQACLIAPKRFETQGLCSIGDCKQRLKRSLWSAVTWHRFGPPWQDSEFFQRIPKCTPAATGRSDESADRSAHSKESDLYHIHASEPGAESFKSSVLHLLWIT
jgi:hypothetical protein